MTPAEALAIVDAWVANENLKRHMLAVGACMAAYAERLGGEPERWRAVGILHDFDWEKHPTLDEHPAKGVAWLREQGVDEEICRAILSHAPRTGVAPESAMERTLVAVDELAGFITAVALMRPERLAGMTAGSVRKKMRQKSFAAAVERDDITRGAELLGVELDEHIQVCIAAMSAIAGELGLEAKRP